MPVPRSRLSLSRIFLTGPPLAGLPDTLRHSVLLLAGSSSIADAPLIGSPLLSGRFSRSHLSFRSDDNLPNLSAGKEVRRETTSPVSPVATSLPNRHSLHHSFPSYPPTSPSHPCFSSTVSTGGDAGLRSVAKTAVTRK